MKAMKISTALLALAVHHILIERLRDILGRALDLGFELAPCCDARLGRSKTIAQSERRCDFSRCPLQVESRRVSCSVLSEVSHDER